MLLFSLLLIASIAGGNIARAACADVKSGNLRSGPGTNYRVTGKVSHNVPLEVLKKEADWSRVRDSAKKVHWIYNDLLSTEFECGIITEQKVNMRAGPSTSHKKLAQAKKGMTFRVKQVRDGWVNGNDGMGEFWVRADLAWIQ